MSRSGRRIAPLRVKAGRSCSGSRGRRRSGDWAAAYVRFVCHRRAAFTRLWGSECGPGSTSDRPSGHGLLPRGVCVAVAVCGRKGVARANSWICYRSLAAWGGLCYPMFEGCTSGGQSARLCCQGARARRAVATGGGRTSSCRRRQRAASCGGGQLRYFRSAAAGGRAPSGGAFGRRAAARGEVCASGGIPLAPSPRVGFLRAPLLPQVPQGLRCIGY
nr:uncharacterized protein LOC116147823 [Camelus dromedarius]